VTGLFHGKPQSILTLPGWQNSDPEHWQSLWEARYGYRRVDQHDWMTPRRGDWMAQLEEVILDADEPVVLVAHSLGCILAAAWASHSKNTHRVKAALLVAPGDAEREALQGLLPSWSPVPMTPLPFPSLLVGSRDDPYCSFERAQAMASAWGATFTDLGNAGHINAETGLGDWTPGHDLLRTLIDMKAN
jgi:predicted alpha/beta hydrolase family esterase